ncbi:hypothetical protein FB451DRAFT_1293081 [Mycena latifolia]|nr:hypothetical protein FB451DRAFT_1293081 [Mycena latifolia]
MTTTWDDTGPFASPLSDLSCLSLSPSPCAAFLFLVSSSLLYRVNLPLSVTYRRILSSEIVPFPDNTVAFNWLSVAFIQSSLLVARTLYLQRVWPHDQPAPASLPAMLADLRCFLAEIASMLPMTRASDVDTLLAINTSSYYPPLFLSDSPHIVLARKFFSLLRLASSRVFLLSAQVSNFPSAVAVRALYFHLTRATDFTVSVIFPNHENT